jgi:hypothetical protein
MCGSWYLINFFGTKNVSFRALQVLLNSLNNYFGGIKINYVVGTKHTVYIFYRKYLRKIT